MKRLFLIFTFPAILIAGNIDLSLKKNKGQSSYIVSSSNFQNLKSKLIFPFNYNSFDFEYGDKLKDFNISISLSFLLNSKVKKGEDYDWHNSNLTVYSHSNNKIDKYYSIGIMLNKNIFYNIDFFAKFNYKILDMYWSNTYQEDYIKNNNEYIMSNTLKFQQKFYKYYLGFSYKNNFFKNISFLLKPSLVFAYVNTKDTHILRDFYATQNAKTFGYAINSELKYRLTMKSNLKISIAYIKIEDKSVNMDYYNKLNEKYLSYPSSYYYKNSAIGIHYSYNF